ncbi:MAG TPA: aminopeptidase, partial [Solirubrobacteraceae bacterium]|nr:aminopeptidase [Solirubrobacteraceae bacterium]
MSKTQDHEQLLDADAFAVLICDWCLEVSQGQQILVQTTTLAEELAAALHRAILERGGWPLLRLTPAGVEADFYRHARELHFEGVAPIELAEAQDADASVRIIAPSSTAPLAEVDPAAVARHALALEPIRAARARRRWSLTIWPTQALADQAGMALADYTRFLRRALFLDRPDPVAAWRALREQQARVIERLAGAREVRIEGPGTDLSLAVSGRTWVNSDGRRNMPSGEVFTG